MTNTNATTPPTNAPDWVKRKVAQRERCLEAHRQSCQTRLGITYEEVLEILHQQNECEACGDTTKLSVDRCRDSKKLRGVLCQSCTVALSVLDSNPLKARQLADYIERYKS